MSFAEQNFGLLNTDWQSTPSPPGMPILCPTVSQCANSTSSALYNVIWGTRFPVLAEPLLQGTSWTSTGGAQSDVSSLSDYLGVRSVTVPAFPHGVLAAVVRTSVAQAGALGDPYGSGVRYTWWVPGVGPVKIVFDHAGASPAPVTIVTLTATNLKATTPRPDQDYFPLRQGLSGTYKWTNSKHFRQAVIEKVSVDAVANRSARIDVKSVSGPIRTLASYGFSLRLDGLTNIYGSESAATLVKFPRLGKSRHFFTPIDLLVFGFNPILPAYPQQGASWKGQNFGRDYQVFGVTGTTTVVGVRTIHVRAGTFRALEVRTVLKQRGFPFGSGVRTSFFAPGRGLVGMLFRHGDGSVSHVDLIK
jgi:hypothetical protein